eukprot:scaffold113544_cov30-Tisochrysis_lutea.AAC.1
MKGGRGGGGGKGAKGRWHRYRTASRCVTLNLKRSSRHLIQEYSFKPADASSKNEGIRPHDKWPDVARVDRPFHSVESARPFPALLRCTNPNKGLSTHYGEDSRTPGSSHHTRLHGLGQAMWRCCRRSMAFDVRKCVCVSRACSTPW